MVCSLKSNLVDRTVVLGVTGSIAAYKSADITSRLTDLGANVFPVLTESACKFIQPLTLQTLARNPASYDLWQEAQSWQPGHVELADQADLLLVAPASAHCIANFAQGFSPDLLSSIHLATQAPTMIAPAMNGKMLVHNATKANISLLRERGYHFIEPQCGQLACGYEGDGKLADVDTIINTVIDFFSQAE